MERKSVNVPSSFVIQALKFKNDTGSGEAKLFIGSTKKLEDINVFFNNCIKNTTKKSADENCNDKNTYKIFKVDLIDYLKRTELEYIAHKCGEYKNADKDYHLSKLEQVNGLPDEILFTLELYYDKSRVYLRTNKEEKWVVNLIREIAIPKITDIVIEKNDYEFIIKLDINYENLCKTKNSEYPYSNEPLSQPHQRIYWGAPGTGKSYMLNKEAVECFGSNIDRVTFHPNYMYGSFVGAFKPFPNEDNQITYKYVPGVLIKVLVKALKHPQENHLLIVEEINRANVAAVFGDIFQLLDRKNGLSEYSIATSEELKVFLKREFNEETCSEDVLQYVHTMLGEDFDQLALPSNMYIWATMNSADQGVMPMDTAFKRRWEFEYFGVNDNLAEGMEAYEFKVSETEKVKWNDFRVALNNLLIQCKVSEDKLIGPYFISKEILDSGDIDKITQTIQNKVLMYLYEDTGKPYKNAVFVQEKSGTYSTLRQEFSSNALSVFKGEAIHNVQCYSISESDSDDGNSFLGDDEESTNYIVTNNE